jgi:hypothetical protein
MIPAKFRPISGIPAEIPGKNRLKIAGIPTIIDRKYRPLFSTNRRNSGDLNGA